MAAATIGAALLPTAINMGANLFGNRESPYEQKLSSMAQMFEGEAAKPITQNREFQSGMKIADRYDQDNRKAINNQSAVTGSTDEAKLGMIETANRARDEQVSRLLSNASRYRSLMQNKALRTYGALNQAGMQRNQQFGQRMNQITQPLGQASSAFLMSRAFGGNDQGQGMGEAGGPGALNTLFNPNQSVQQPYNNPLA